MTLTNHEPLMENGSSLNHHHHHNLMNNNPSSPYGSYSSVLTRPYDGPNHIHHSHPSLLQTYSSIPSSFHVPYQPRVSIPLHHHSSLHPSPGTSNNLLNSDSSKYFLPNDHMMMIGSPMAASGAPLPHQHYTSHQQPIGSSLLSTTTATTTTTTTTSTVMTITPPPSVLAANSNDGPSSPTTTATLVRKNSSTSSCCPSGPYTINEPSNTSYLNGTTTSTTTVSIDKICYGCHQTLSTSPIIASVSGYHNWHINCLCCSECGQSLSQSRSCYIRNGRIYCKDDYIKMIKCSKCDRTISASDWVRRAGMLVYHLACFACDLCQRQLSTGEKFTIEKQPQQQQSPAHQSLSSPTFNSSTSHNANFVYRLICKLHFGIKEDETQPQNDIQCNPNTIKSSSNANNSTLSCSILQSTTTTTSQTNTADTNGTNGNSKVGSSSMLNNVSDTSGASQMLSRNGSGNGGDSSNHSSSNNNQQLVNQHSTNGRSNSSLSSNSNSKTKRVRTTFTEDQLSVLQANFQLDSNPDGQDLERIAALTGLSKRVTQVWFQNSRARQKKFMSKSSSSHHNHHHHQPHPIAQQQHRHSSLGLLDTNATGQQSSGVSLMINEQQTTPTRSNGGGGMWSPGTTTSSTSSQNGLQDNPGILGSSSVADVLLTDHQHQQQQQKISIWTSSTSSLMGLSVNDSNTSQNMNNQNSNNLCSESEHSSLLTMAPNGSNNGSNNN